jgi:hypothetical protein
MQVHMESDNPRVIVKHEQTSRSPRWPFLLPEKEDLMEGALEFAFYFLLPFFLVFVVERIFKV